MADHLNGAPILRRRMVQASLTSLLARFVDVGALLGAEQKPAVPGSPQDLLERYRRMDSQGERLTDDGWLRASKFFVKPEPPPKSRVIAVMKAETVNYVALKGDSAYGFVDCDAVGQIDSRGRFVG